MNSNGYEAVPEILRTTPQWAVWKSIPQTSRAKPLKVPFMVSGQPADTRHPGNWGEFTTALDTWYEHQGQYNGLGFLFTSEDCFAGLDIDNCVVNGEILPEARKIIAEFDTYTEFSPSGTGVKLFLGTEWKPPADSRQGLRQNGMELYFSRRYFTVTGHAIPGSPTKINNCTDALHSLYHRLLLLQTAETEPIELYDAIELPDDFLESVARRNPNVAGRIESETLAARCGADVVEQLYIDRESRVDRSRNDMYIATWLLGHGYKPGHVLSVLNHPTWFSGSKSRDKNTQNYALTTLNRAMSSVKHRRRTLPDASMHWTEQGNAERLIAAHGNNLRYNEVKGGWLTWSGSCWLPDRTGAVVRYLHEVVRGLHEAISTATDEKASKGITAWAFKSETHKVQTASLSIARSLEGVSLPFESFDNSPWHFPALNGVIDLRTGEMAPHAREHYFTCTSPLNYDPNARCPKWEHSLRTWLPDDDLRLFVQRAVGYTLTGNTSEQVFFFLHGLGSNGKSTFMLVLQGLLGRFARRITTEAITQHKMGSPGTIRDQAAARLAGARMGIVSEAEQNMRLAEGWLKDMTGGGPVSTKILYKDQGETLPTVKIWFDANYRLRAAPGTTDGGDAEYDAFWRRMREIPFTVRVDKETRIKDFHRVLLSEEGAGILAWAVEGCLDWQENGLPIPQAVRQATQDYRSEMDTLRPFITQTLVKEPGSYVTQKELYVAYKFWASADGETAVQKRVLRDWLKERGFDLVQHNGQECWKGYKLRNPVNHIDQTNMKG